jgi:hypothetical protein
MGYQAKISKTKEATKTKIKLHKLTAEWSSVAAMSDLFPLWHPYRSKEEFITQNQAANQVKRGNNLQKETGPIMSLTTMISLSCEKTEKTCSKNFGFFDIPARKK